MLKIGGELYAIKGSPRFENNQQLTLKILKISPRITFKVTASTEKETSAIKEEPSVLIGNLLTQRTDMKTGLMRLFQMMEILKENTLQESIGSLTDHIPNKNELSKPEGLRKGLLQSGTFLESSLLKMGELIPGDRKAALLKLLNKLALLKNEWVSMHVG